MATMNPYLNFDGQAEAAFLFYQSVFGAAFTGLYRMSDAPDAEKIPEPERSRLMHISLPIDAHTTLMGADILPSFGHQLTAGNNVQLSLHPDSREEAERLFNGLSAGGVIEMPLADTFWGAYFGSFRDQFGIYWMVNYDKGAK